MKIKKYLGIIVPLLSSLVIVSCGENSLDSSKESTTTDTTSDTSTSLTNSEITEEIITPSTPSDNYRNYYEIFVRSFYDSNADKIGDLNGVTLKLDYIKNLGCNGIWLMPINTSNSYHKYDILDYYNVDKSYGTLEDLDNLIKECHARGIKLILDLVLNHSSLSHPYYTKAVLAHQKWLDGETLTSEEEKFKDFYSFYDTKEAIPGYLESPAYQVANHTFYVEDNFAKMPEFNFDSQYVRAEFRNIMKFYLDRGIDGFRLDAVKYYYLSQDSKNIAYLKELNEYVKSINPEAYIVGECWSGTSTIKSYYESGIDSFFNFDTSVTNSSGIIGVTSPYGRGIKSYYNLMLANDEISLGSGISAPFIDNHDTPRFTTTLPKLVAKSKFQYGCLSMFKGSTFTYYGDEVGMTGTNAGEEPDENVRLAMQWGEDKNLGNARSPDGITTSHYYYPSVKEQLSDDNSILSYYKKALYLRNRFPLISHGNTTLVEIVRDPSCELFVKKGDGEDALGIVYNCSSDTYQDVEFISKGFKNVVGQLVADKTLGYLSLNSDGSLHMPPYSIAILK